jgi:hypothetical protein
MKHRTKIIIFIILCFNTELMAWGPVAHKAVGLIADSMLSPQARWATQKILGHETLAGVSTWADEVRGKKTYYKQTAAYHFESVPDNSTYMESLRALSDTNKRNGGVVTAISVAISLLREPSISDQDRYDALKFLVHFVGDIHQPLHSGRPEDLGGNRISVKWFGDPSNLHSIWDSGMINVGHGEIVKNSPNPTDAAMAYARYLVETQKNYVVPLGIDVEGWLNESLAYREQAYNGPYETDQTLYLQSNLPFVDFRVYEAGVRLAYVLNQIYAQSTIELSEHDLWMRIQEVLGPLYNLISFRP